MRRETHSHLYCMSRLEPMKYTVRPNATATCRAIASCFLGFGLRLGLRLRLDMTSYEGDWTMPVNTMPLLTLTLTLTLTKGGWIAG